MDCCFAVCFLADSPFVFGDQILLACTAQNMLYVTVRRALN